MKRVLIGLLLVLVLVGAAFAGSTVLSRISLPTVRAAAAPVATVARGQAAVAPALTQSEVLTGLETALENVYQQVSPSVVFIEVTEAAQANPYGMSPRFRQQQQAPQQQGSGSGFVWDKAGNIVTNNHVVENATDIQVTFTDGTTAKATVVGTDPNSDLAVIKVDVAAAKLQPVTMADSTLVKVGQIAIAIGNPFGLENTMTVGFVSALGRSLPADSATSSRTYSIPDVIQTDAAINPGNSGGVLLNSIGQVIGVTSAIYSPVGTNAGIGFSVPSAAVSRVVPELIRSGHYASSWLGISASTLTTQLASAMNLGADQHGVLIGEVVAGGPAEKAGLKAGTESTTIAGQDYTIGGDVITAIDGQAVTNFEGLVTYLSRSTTPGQKAMLTILRAGKEQTVQVTIGERPAATPEPAPTESLG
jgi:S1-C subfamily serine protease